MASEFRLSFTATEIDRRLSEIDNLAKKTDIPSKLSELTNDSNFATENYVDTAIANIDIPEVDLSGYALKSEIPTDYLTTIPSEYITETELNEKGFATETYVNDTLTSKQDAITGTAGQFVVIGIDGKPTTKTIPYAEEATF